MEKVVRRRLLVQDIKKLSPAERFDFGSYRVQEDSRGYWYGTALLQ